MSHLKVHGTKKSQPPTGSGGARAAAAAAGALVGALVGGGAAPSQNLEQHKLSGGSNEGDESGGLISN